MFLSMGVYRNLACYGLGSCALFYLAAGPLNVNEARRQRQQQLLRDAAAKDLEVTSTRI